MRRFLWIAAGVVMAVAVAGCRQSGSSALSSTSQKSTPRSSSTVTTVTTGTSAAKPCPAVTVHDPKPDASGLTDVQFVGATRGWAVGSRRILATVDGGAHWKRQFRGDVQTRSVDFVDADHGWALGNTVLLATTDGGRCWKVAGEPARPLTSVHFATATVGFGVNSRGLVTTTNAGRTWSRLGAPTNPTSVCFTTPSTGWLGTANFGVYRSSDAGRSWRLAFRNTTDHSDPSLHPETVVQCAGSGVWVRFDGFGGAAGNNPYVDYASANGTDFTPVAGNMLPDAPSTNPGSYPGPISTISASQAVVSGFTPAAGHGKSYAVLVTGTTGGHVRPIAGLTEVIGLSFIDANTGWAVGQNGTHAAIVHTTDGGAHWTTQKIL